MRPRKALKIIPKAHLGFITKELERHRVRNFERQRTEVERRSVKLEINAHVLVHMTAS